MHQHALCAPGDHKYQAARYFLRLLLLVLPKLRWDVTVLSRGRVLPPTAPYLAILLATFTEFFLETPELSLEQAPEGLPIGG